VCLVQDGSSGCFLVALVVPGSKRPGESEPSTWLLMADGGCSGCLKLMQVMCKHGSLRYDFTACFDLDRGLVLGRGAFSMIRRAQVKERANFGNEGDTFAVKLVEQGAPTLFRELETLAKMQGHRHVISFEGCFGLDDASPHSWAIVLEYCTKGDLFMHVTGVGAEPEESAKCIFRELLLALAHLHSAGFAHRDVKPRNVLRRADGSTVLTDFGIACSVSDEVEMTRSIGSRGYTAPEVKQARYQGRYTETVDCFSCGATAFFVLTGQMAFNPREHSEEVLLRRMVSGKFNIEMLCANGLSLSCRDFITCLLKVRGQRPGAEAALAHDWFSDPSVNEAQVSNDFFNSSPCLQQPCTVAGTMTTPTLPVEERQSGFIAEPSSVWLEAAHVAPQWIPGVVCESEGSCGKPSCTGIWAPHFSAQLPRSIEIDLVGSHYHFIVLRAAHCRARMPRGIEIDCVGSLDYFMVVPSSIVKPQSGELRERWQNLCCCLLPRFWPRLRRGA